MQPEADTVMKVVWLCACLCVCVSWDERADTNTPVSTDVFLLSGETGGSLHSLASLYQVSYDLKMKQRIITLSDNGGNFQEMSG